MTGALFVVGLGSQRQNLARSLEFDVVSNTEKIVSNTLERIGPLAVDALRPKFPRGNPIRTVTHSHVRPMGFA
jgi:hypothetical protein